MQRSPSSSPPQPHERGAGPARKAPSGGGWWSSTDTSSSGSRSGEDGDGAYDSDSGIRSGPATSDDDDDEVGLSAAAVSGGNRGRAASSLTELCRAVLPDLLSRFLNIDLNGLTRAAAMPPPVRGWRTIAERALVDAAHAPAFRAFTTDPEELGRALHAHYRIIRQRLRIQKERAEKSQASNTTGTRWTDEQKQFVRAIGKRLQKFHRAQDLDTPHARVLATLEELRTVARSSQALSDGDREHIVSSCDACLEDDAQTGRKKRRASPWVILSQTHLFRDRTSKAIRSHLAHCSEDRAPRHRQSAASKPQGRPAQVAFLQRELHELRVEAPRPTRELPEQLKAMAWQLKGFGPISFAVYGALDLYLCMASALQELTNSDHLCRDVTALFVEFSAKSVGANLIESALMSNSALLGHASLRLPLFSHEAILYFITGFPKAAPGKRAAKTALAREALRYADAHDDPADLRQRRLGANFPFLGATPLITPSKLSVPMGRKPSSSLDPGTRDSLDRAREALLAERLSSDTPVVTREDVSRWASTSELVSKVIAVTQSKLQEADAWRSLALI